MYTLQLFTPYSLIAISCAGLFSFAVGWIVWASGCGLSRLRLAVLTFAVILPFVLFILAVATLSINVPFWDDYDAILGYLVRTPSERMGHLFAFHNEHRIAFARLVVEAIYRLTGTFDFRVMIYAGNALFLLYVALLLRRLTWHAVVPSWWVVPVAWSLLSILMYENMLWALTSVTSNAVLLFAWLSLLSLERGGRAGWFAASLAFGVLSTFTSGAGLFIWFCMAGMIAKRWYFEGVRLSPAKLALLVVVAGVAVAGYLHGFHGQGEGALGKALTHPLNVFTYAALFCGASMHFPALAFPCGIGVMVVAFLLLFWVGRIRDNVTFFFLGFLLCSVFSAALFRCGDLPTQALSFRYRVIAVSILVCCGLLVYEQVVQPFKRDTRRLCAVMAAFCIFGNLSAFLLAYPQLVARRDRQLEGIKNWPSDCSGLVYPDTKRASEVLENSVKSGVYRPVK